MDPLAIINNIQFDDRITKVDEYVFKPYNNTAINESDEIRIAVQSENILALPSESFIYLEGTFTQPDGSATTAKIANNGMAFLFDEVRIDLNGVTIDRTRNVGITTLIKNLISLNLMESNKLENAGWATPDSAVNIVTNNKFSACIPLNKILGFAEDFNHVIVNIKMELILIRAKNTTNVSIGTAADPGKVTLTHIDWRLPVITVKDTEKLKVLKYIENDMPLTVPFRSWELYEHPSLPQTTNHSWNIATALKLERPRYVIVGFQTDKTGVDKDASKFDHCSITDLRVYLNGERFPYNDYKLDFTNHKIGALYEHYANFQSSYYGNSQWPLLTKSTFIKHAPLFVIDCSKQKEDIKLGAINISLEFSSSTNIPANTSAFCLIIHDRVVEYTPLTNIVRIVI